MSNGITINVRNALAQGASREDLAKGRFAFASCTEKTDVGVVERDWLARVPADLGFLGYPIATEFGEIRPGTPKDRTARQSTTSWTNRREIAITARINPPQ